MILEYEIFHKSERSLAGMSNSNSSTHSCRDIEIIFCRQPILVKFPSFSRDTGGNPMWNTKKNCEQWKVVEGNEDMWRAMKSCGSSGRQEKTIEDTDKENRCECQGTVVRNKGKLWKTKFWISRKTRQGIAEKGKEKLNRTCYKGIVKTGIVNTKYLRNTLLIGENFNFHKNGN